MGILAQTCKKRGVKSTGKKSGKWKKAKWEVFYLICRMVEFLIDNIFVKFGGCLFRQVIGIPVGTNCAPLLADLFLYSYENEFLDNMIRGSP